MICLVYLVWAPLGPEPVERFLASYRAHESGAEHELLFVLNGFDSGASAPPVPGEALRLQRPMLDLAAYRCAAEHTRAERVCFVNSFTEPRAAGWLGLLARALDQPGIGLVGATASWGSHRSMMRYDLGLGGPYGSAFENRSAARETLRSLQAPVEPGSRSTTGLARGIEFARLATRQLAVLSAFPAPHVRTNGFLIERSMLLDLRLRTPRTKIDAYAIESGRRSITRQVEARGQKARVVGADGRAFDRDDWSRSGTFWQGEQGNLLLEDNQTRIYRDGSERVRLALSRYAWGNEASGSDP